MLAHQPSTVVDASLELKRSRASERPSDFSLSWLDRKLDFYHRLLVPLGLKTRAPIWGRLVGTCVNLSEVSGVSMHKKRDTNAIEIRTGTRV